MIAFADAFIATKWALEVQQLLVDAEWPEALYNHPDSAIE